MSDTQDSLIEVQDLRISFHHRQPVVEAVKGIDFHLNEGETLAIVGESGSGKSVSAMALTRLLPKPPLCEVSGHIRYKDNEVLTMRGSQLRNIRGKDIAYIFQEPASSLNPVFSVGYQIAEAVKLHLPDVKNIRGYVVDVLKKVGIRDADKRYDAYPHELSGGMQQRVMIAMALACNPKVLIADEPTTALDVTIQKQIMDLLRDLRQRNNMAIILITHNFGIVKDFADRVLVMFRGKIVESGLTHDVLRNPKHPYTKALIGCIPQLGAQQKRLVTVDYEMIEQHG